MSLTLRLLDGVEAVEATMSLTLRLLDGVEETGHIPPTPSTRHLEEGSAPPTRRDERAG